jgi:RHS repeat-associated protein
MSNSAYAYTPEIGNMPFANNGRDQVTSAGGAGVGYDGRQNITSAPMGSYGYNGANELTSATVGGTTTGLSYDPAGRLYQVGATRFLYDGVQAIGEYDLSGNMVKRYVPGLGLNNVVTAYEGAGYDRRWLQSDERGSVVSITDGAGAAVTINTYDEYGVPGAGNGGRFQYTGQMWLPQARLYHYRARAYAPTLGRFMQTDLIGYADGPNLYAYVRADPVNWGDPAGLSAETVITICQVDGEQGKWSWEELIIGACSGPSSGGSLTVGGTGWLGGGGGIYSDPLDSGGNAPPELPSLPKLNCELGQRQEAAGEGVKWGGYSHDFLGEIVERGVGPEAAKAFKPLSSILSWTGIGLTVAQGIERGQSVDVIVANLALPAAGSYAGARIGGLLGLIGGGGFASIAIGAGGAIGGAFVGDEAGALAADGYAQYRGQYCE